MANPEAEAFAEACPGAGKTRTVVARVLALLPQLGTRRGIAILSFTNSAVDEFYERCRKRGVSHLLRFPSFVGTFDAFVRAYLVMPFGVPPHSSRPTVVDSWRSLGVEIRLSGEKAFKGRGVSLDLFSPETGTIDPVRISVPALREHVVSFRAEYEDAARSKRKGLHRTGYFSADDLRAVAAWRIRKPDRCQGLGRALAARFHEIVVDEAQDCNPLDLKLLQWLRAYGIRVTIICDPDQAIYGFRHGAPQDLREFSLQYPIAQRHQLTGNFRSSAAITRLAATLRARQEPDEALGDTAGVEHRVLLAGYAGRTIPVSVGRLFVARLRAKPIELTLSDGIILAHRWADAHRAAGLPQPGDGGTSHVERVARAVGGFWSASATSYTRRAHLHALERLLLEALGHWRDGDRHSRRVIERCGLNGRHLRRLALNLLMRLPTTCEDSERSRTAWIASLREAVGELCPTRPQGLTVKKFLRSPSGPDWAQHLVVRQAEGTMRCATVHEAKGREYEAVCVVLRPDTPPDYATGNLLAAWEGRTESEAKRVIYVGVTRARRFVMVAVPTALSNRCAHILTRGNVPFEHVSL